MDAPTRLLYVVDPMCSWCYGFSPTLTRVLADLDPAVQVELLAGGLAPDSDEPMDATTRSYVQRAWRAVTERTGVEFNHDVWTECAPRRSTYPACRAMIVARAAGKGEAMLAAIQRAYYREARNPSDTATLAALAGELGLDPVAFEAALASPATEQQLQADLTRARSIGASSFPSLALDREGRTELIASGCLGEPELRAILGAAGLLRSPA
ncbi:MAG: DsbA family protein [Planctomycetota bacterium]|nr:DsbA family protein [Planctomycetota bacterium]